MLHTADSETAPGGDASEKLAPQITATIRSPLLDQDAPPRVSVVVSTRQRAGFLPRLLGSLERQDLGISSFEVVIVDDASPDDTWDVLEHAGNETALRLHALRLGESAGQGHCRNVGVAACRGDIVAFTDDDCVPERGWLSNLIAPFEADGRTEPARVVVQGRTEPWSEELADAGVWARTIRVDRPTWLFETCNIAYRRVDLQRAGGFPLRGEAPETPEGKLIGEDAITGWRVVDAGATLRFRRDALVYHRYLPASYLEWLSANRGVAVFPDLLRRSPSGRRVLWGRWFLSPRTAAFDAAVLSLVVSLLSRRTKWLAGTLPWVWMALPEASWRPGRHPVVRLGQIALGDLVRLDELIRASLRHRSIVL